MDDYNVRLQIVCLDAPPAGDQPMIFGLQDKKPSLDAGMALHTGGTLFDCSLVGRQAEGSVVRWSGPFAQGTAKEPFLYLSLATEAAPTTWVRRWKIMLGTITWDDVLAADDPNACLRGTIAELKGTRPTFVEGTWIVAVREVAL